MENRKTLIGTVLSVIFQNMENGYAVLRVVTEDGEVVTAVGCIPCAAPGETLVLTGGYTVHPQYGEQFSADEAERRLPESETDILTFLASGSVAGIGPATAQKLVDSFGAEALAVLESEPEKLSKIKGITARRAREMSESFREQMGLRRLLEFFTGCDLPVTLAMQLYRRCGAESMNTLRRDPYVLCESRYGVDFSVADEIALSQGFGDDAVRTQGGILFELSHNETAVGHMFLPRGKLVAASAELLGVDDETVEKALDDLLDSGRVVEEHVANVEACYQRRCWDAENYVCTRLNAMLADRPDRFRGADRVMEEIERQQGISYAPLQKKAVTLAAEEEVLLLTGGPGTGKTTAVRGILTLFERMGLKVLLTAPTGRAAQRLGEVCGRDAQTVHRLLGMGWSEETGTVTCKKCEKDPLEADAVIVDETSMVDLELMCALLAALRPGCRLVLVGDADQLPSVGAGNVFGDLLRSERIASVTLREVFRQAEKSAIIRSAHSVNNGILPDLHPGKESDYFFMPRRDPVRLVETVVELCKTRLPEHMNIPADQIQVLCPTRRGPSGTAALNRALQQALIPAQSGKRERAFGDMVFREGDRVMQIRNDYDIVWEKADGTAGNGIFNGDVGKILTIDPSGELLTIAFDDRTATYTSEMLAELDMAYAMTVHKAQGSEYSAVLFVCAPCAPGLMVRGVLYTGITRARELLIMVGDDTVLAKMTENDRRERRYSGLRWRLAEGNKK